MDHCMFTPPSFYLESTDMLTALLTPLKLRFWVQGSVYWHHHESMKFLCTICFQIPDNEEGEGIATAEVMVVSWFGFLNHGSWPWVSTRQLPGSSEAISLDT